MGAHRHRTIPVPRRGPRRARPFVGAALVWTTACTQPPAPHHDEPGGAELSAVVGPPTVVEGTRLVVRGTNLEAIGPDRRLRLVHPSGTVELPLDPAPPCGCEHVVGPELIRLVGEGPRRFEAYLVGPSRRSNAVDVEFELLRELPLVLREVRGGAVHRNERWLLHGEGFVAPGEGSMTVRFDGSFQPATGGPSRAVEVELRAEPAERFARDRLLVRLTTAIGGLGPGRFEGHVSVRRRMLDGSERTTDAHAVTLDFRPPELLGIEPARLTLEQRWYVRGAGFVGGPDEPDEATVLRLEGTWTPREGSPRPWGPRELVLEWVSGEQLRGAVETMVRDGRLVSTLFGDARGAFEGRAAVTVVKGAEEVDSASVPVRFELGGMRQVVWLRFLPGFYDSLEYFGLRVAADEIEQRIADRIEAIYAGWQLEVRFERPEDVSSNGFATLEIGGPDPNGMGLFGYDNTPGKDVGNLRLFDAIGGTNAQTQADGHPGYGGVFIDSYLYWSRHPGLPGPRPVGAPPPDPLFDEIFDPVRRRPARLEELRGSSARAQAVQRAVRALGSIAGETAAHELGHSLGLAQPYGSPTAYHNDFDTPGCLMDAGGDRPLGERAEEPGYASTVLCHDEPAYLDDLLGL
ncbi:MAG: hypothetical protein RMK74_15025 [Myxococcales bacterium]|nr:hypothetical protein [Myxococcales bacterium]